MRTKPLALCIATALAGFVWSATDATASDAAVTPMGSAANFISNPNVGIPDDGYNGSLGSMACDTIDASSIPVGSTVTGVEIGTAIDHPWIGDLVIKLQSPDGTVLGVLSRPGFDEPADDGTGCCGAGSNLASAFPLTFRDGAAADAETMGGTIGNDQVVCQDDATCEFFPNPGAVAQPPANFAGFNGEETSGNWTLCIGDSEVADVGTFVSWELDLFFIAGGDPELTITPDPLDFGDVQVGTTSATQSVTLANPGTADLTITALDSAAAPFADDGGTCGAVPITIVAGADCTLSYNFSPAATGPFSQTLNLTSDAVVGPASFDLNGVGVDSELVIAPDPLDFGMVTVGDTSATQSVTLSNTGAVDLTITAVDSAAAPFADAGGTCGAVPILIASGGSCTLSYTFSPAAEGVFMQIINLTSNAGAGAADFTLQGEGLGVPLPAAQPIPSLNRWGLLGGVLLVLTVAGYQIRRWNGS